MITIILISKVLSLRLLGCPKSNHYVIAKEERLKQSLDYQAFQNRLLRNRSQWQLKDELFGQPL
jgi:hypothetical protein